jgi:hypothetical protein
MLELGGATVNTAQSASDALDVFRDPTSPCCVRHQRTRPRWLRSRRVAAAQLPGAPRTSPRWRSPATRVTRTTRALRARFDAPRETVRDGRAV